MSSIQGTCVCIKCYTCLGIVWPKKGQGLALYKLRPNINMMLVYQDDARVLPWCLEQTQNPFVYCGYLFVAFIYLWILFWFILPFCCFFGNWYFGYGFFYLICILHFLCALVHILQHEQSFWHCK